MIRSIASGILIIGSIINMLLGFHPVYGMGMLVLGVILAAWVCVNKFEDEPRLGNN